MPWLVLALLTGFACGPSLTNVHEGTVRFEHCNRLDLDRRVTKDACQTCWRTWLAEYTYGQPRDRIDYARRRLKALENGNAERPTLRIDEDRPAQRQFYLVVPGPTSVRTPPPPIATVWQGIDAGTPAKVMAEAPPAESCADGCRTTWQSCSASCSEADGGTPAVPAGAGRAGTSRNDKLRPAFGAGACEKCRSDYASCMRGCFD